MKLDLANPAWQQTLPPARSLATDAPVAACAFIRTMQLSYSGSGTGAGVAGACCSGAGTAGAGADVNLGLI